MLLRLLSGLDLDAFAVRVVSSGRDECTRRAADLDGVAVDVVPYRGALDRYGEAILDGGPVSTVATALGVLQFDAEAREPIRWADAVWTDCLRTLLTVAPATLATRTPTIWNVGLGRTGGGVDRWLNALGLLVADRVFVESRRQVRRTFTDAQLVRHTDAFEVFHKGVDVERFRPREGVEAIPSGAAADGAGAATSAHEATGAYRIGTAARITQRKGLEDVLEAVAALTERHDLHLDVAGAPVDDADRAYQRRLERLVEARGLDGTVSFRGYVEDMPAFYAGLDLFVLPSHDEGVPGTVREALASGVPVVATDVGGTADVVGHGETGLLVAPGNPSALADAIEQCIDRPDEARLMARAGRELVVEEFSAAAYVERYEAFLREVVAG